MLFGTSLLPAHRQQISEFFALHEPHHQKIEYDTEGDSRGEPHRLLDDHPAFCPHVSSQQEPSGTPHHQGGKACLCARPQDLLSVNPAEFRPQQEKEQDEVDCRGKRKGKGKPPVFHGTDKHDAEKCVRQDGYNSNLQGGLWCPA